MTDKHQALPIPTHNQEISTCHKADLAFNIKTIECLAA
jgi:hypothetical protein